jgi:hypothetical protein
MEERRRLGVAGRESPVRMVGSCCTSTNEGRAAGPVERFRAWLIPSMKATAPPGDGSSHSQNAVAMT